MTELNKIFKHLARDFFVYFLTGFIFVINLAYLDYLYNNASTYNYIKNIEYWTIITIMLSYLVGHLIFALMYFVFEYSEFENWLKVKKFPLNGENNQVAFQIDYEKEIKIFTNNADLHEQFIERHTQLYLMRWNFSAGLMFCGLINLIFQIIFPFHFGFTILSFILILIGFSLYFLSLKTEKDCYDRINKIHEINRQN